MTGLTLMVAVLLDHSLLAGKGLTLIRSVLLVRAAHLGAAHLVHRNNREVLMGSSLLVHNNLLAGKGLVRSRVSALMTSLRAVAHPLALTLLTFPQSSLHQFRLKKFWREKSGTLFSANSTHF